MKSKLLPLLMLFIVSNAVYAQNTTSPSYTLKGVLLDSLTLEGEPYATIRIVKKSQPDKAVKMAVTDMQGKFQEKINAVPGIHTITITSIGKSTVIKDFEVKVNEKIIDLGTLYTSEATNELGSVEIVAQKPLVKADIDKINSIDNLLEKAIILNLWLSYCQFFYDGNKRTARLSSNLILLSNDIGVLSIPARYKVEYNKLMLDFYETLEADEVIKFILEKCITFFDGFNYKKYNELI